MQRKSAQSQLDAARQKLTADQSHLEQIVAGPSDEQVQIAQNAVDQAAQALALAEQPNTQSMVAGQRALVEQANQALLRAEYPYTDYDLQQQQHAAAHSAAALAARENPYTDQDIATAQAQVEQAEAAVQQAELALQQTKIIAPIDGSVGERLVNPGALVSPQTPVVTLIPPDVEVDTSVDGTKLTMVRTGDPVRITIPAAPNQSFAGTVTSVAPMIDPKTQTAAVQVKPDDPRVLQMYPGMQALVTFVGASPTQAQLPPASRPARPTSGVIGAEVSDAH
jgi:multidrug resistance efflux pump